MHVEILHTDTTLSFGNLTNQLLRKKMNQLPAWHSSHGSFYKTLMYCDPDGGWSLHAYCTGLAGACQTHC